MAQCLQNLQQGLSTNEAYSAHEPRSNWHDIGRIRQSAYRILKRGMLYGFLSFASISWALPDFETVRSQWKSADVIILDRHGQALQRVRVDHSVRRHDWLSLNEVSPILREALLLSEDKRFYQHKGVDWSAALAAAWANLWGRNIRGASTLTMQLAGLLNDDLKVRRGSRSVWQKLEQSWSASWLETHWSKDQILEAYLNLVSFRGEQVGLAAMALALFDKLPIGLNAEEAALAVALIRAPNAHADKVARRACFVLREMHAAQLAMEVNVEQSCARLAVKTALILTRKQRTLVAEEPALAIELAPHFSHKLLQRQPFSAGATIVSTIDANLQRYTNRALQRHLIELAKRNVQDGAVLVLDNRSGDILAWVGSSGAHLSTAAEVDGVTALRQAGSTLKPFLYQQALQERWLTAASLLDDSAIEVPTLGGAYVPQNYSKDFKGLVSVRTALAASLNIPAVQAIEMVTSERFRERLFDLGLNSLTQDGDYYGASLALGAADVRLLDLANAYRVLANGGLYGDVRWTLADGVPAPVRKVDAASSFIIVDILADRVARARTFGLESALATPYWSAVKTGTSKDMRDNWTIGFSRDYTVAVWVGNASGEPMWDVSGMHGAAPIWSAVLDYLQKNSASLSSSLRLPTAASSDFLSVQVVPPELVQTAIQYEDNTEAPRREWFIRGTERTRIAAKRNVQQQRDATPAIIAPLNDSIYALDPDIPPANQRLVFRSRGVSVPQWWLDGKYLGAGEKFAWFPWPGFHQLELRDGRAKSISIVKFNVRGAMAIGKAPQSLKYTESKGL